MAFIKFLFTSKNKYINGKAPRIKLGKFTLSKHALYRMIERNIKKGEVISHIYGKPLYNTRIKMEKDGSFSYNRVGRKITTNIIPGKRLIKTMYRTGYKKLKKYNKGEKFNVK